MKRLPLTLFLYFAFIPYLLSDDPVRIDILVLHTEAVTDYYHGEEGITAHILSTMDASNAALENSDINMVWNLVGIEEVSYTESSTSLGDDLENLTYAENGLEDVHDLRDAYGADLVSLFRRGSVGGTAGLAWRLNGDFPQVNFGYNVVSDQAALSGFTFAHEVGHNLSSGHHRGDPSGGNPELEPSYGYLFPGTDGIDYRTIMATDFDYTRIPHFSNPLVSFAGTPTGLPESDPESADNATSFASVGPKIEDFRSAQPALPEILFEPRGTTIVTDGQANLSTLVNGLPPLSLEWFEGQAGNESSPVANANERDLFLESMNESSRFWLKASNPEGTAESKAARIVVVPPPDGPYETIVSQSNVTNGYFIDPTLWQEMIFPEGYVDFLEIKLFKSDSGNGTDYPRLQATLLRGNSQIVHQSLIDPDDVTQFLSSIFLPIQAFVQPGTTYRLELSIFSGGSDGDILFAGQDNTVDPGAGVGESQISANDPNSEYAFFFDATGTDATTYHRWVADEGLSADLEDSETSLTEDQVPNLLRYALGGGASDDGLTLLPALQDVTVIDDEEVLPFRFTQRRDMVDVDLQVEVSTDLENWNPLDASFIHHLDGLDTSTTRTYEARLPTASDDKAFLRLNAENPPQN